MFLPHLSLFWLGFICGILALAFWQHYVKGRIRCFFIGCGYAWAVLKEEVMRRVRVIKKALQRDITLDEHEEHISG